MAQVVEILDSIMGSNKTNKIIEWIDSHPNERYIYISPLLSEVDNTSRLATNLNHVSFEYPSNEEDSDTKIGDFLLKLESGANISCTHNLYLSMSDKHLELIEQFGYTVIIDEEVGVIENFKKYTPDDLQYLKRNGDISISDEDGMISWIGEDIGNHAKYKQFYNLCRAKAVYATKRSDSMLVTQMPVELFTRAKRVIIMSYMFEGNILDAFLKLKKVQTKPFLEVNPTPTDMEVIKSLITLKPLDKHLDKLSLSTGGYEKMTKDGTTQIQNYIRNVGVSCNAKAVDMMYTFPKDLVQTKRSNGKSIKPKGYTNYKLPVLDGYGDVVLDRKGKQLFETFPCWIASNCRATNKYSFKSCLVHCYNRYPNTAVDVYLSEYGSPIDRNTFALSEMLQWIWRSRIRKGESIVLAIASKRMHTLFVDWLNQE